MGRMRLVKVPPEWIKSIGLNIRDIIVIFFSIFDISVGTYLSRSVVRYSFYLCKFRRFQNNFFTWNEFYDVYIKFCIVLITIKACNDYGENKKLSQ